MDYFSGDWACSYVGFSPRCNFRYSTDGSDRQVITRIYFWKVSKRSQFWALLRMGLDRRNLKRNRRIGFWKLLGTGKGETFTPRDADPTRWGLLVTIEEDALKDFENSRVIRRWDNKSKSRFRATLRCISVHGSWSGKKPFHHEVDPRNWNGPVAAITRARIKWRKSFVFWRAVPPVTSSLLNSEGLKRAIGIGEAPLGLQGTFSLWSDPLAVSKFAYRGSEHKEAISATAREKWYSEELFGRFAIIESAGEID
jgi:hypothetical protein